MPLYHTPVFVFTKKGGNVPEDDEEEAALISREASREQIGPKKEETDEEIRLVRSS